MRKPKQTVVAIQKKFKYKSKWVDHQRLYCSDKFPEKDNLAYALHDVSRRLPGGVFDDIAYMQDKDWRVVIRETRVTETVVEQ
jgi:hypothetical protein